MTEQLLTDRDLCRLLSLSRVSTWRLRKKGDLPFIKLQQGIRYQPDQIAAFIASHQRGAQHQTGVEQKQAT